jgi:hypothetical protein
MVSAAMTALSVTRLSIMQCALGYVRSGPSIAPRRRALSLITWHLAAVTIEERRYRLKIARSLVYCGLAKTEPGRTGVLLRHRAQLGFAGSGT